MVINPQAKSREERAKVRAAKLSRGSVYQQCDFFILSVGTAFFCAPTQHRGLKRMAVSLAGKDNKALSEERAALVTKAQAYHTEHEESWSSEHDAVFGEMLSDAQSLKDQMGRLNKLASLATAEAVTASGDGATLHDDPMAGLRSGGRGEKQRMVMLREGRTSSGQPRYVPVAASRRGSEQYRTAFQSALSTARGFAGLDEVTGIAGGISQYATLQSDSAQQAGYLVAEEEFASDLLKEVDDLVFIRRRAKVHQVPVASSLGIRKRTSRLNSFAWSSELEVSANDTALKYGKKVLTPHHLTGSVKISRDLARRSSMIVGEVRGELARDAGEKMEDGYMLGTGDRQPMGVFVASSDGISTARDVQTGSATNITADGLISAKYALKSQYRRGQRGEISWLFHRDAIKLIALLKDGENQYLFRVGAGFASDNQAPEDMLLGYPVDESERAPHTFTTGLYVGLLANWRYYEIADALDMEIQVLTELNARTNEYEYIGRLKTDGMPTLEEAFVRLKTN